MAILLVLFFRQGKKSTQPDKSKKGSDLPLLLLSLFLLPNAEDPPQDRGDKGRGAQNHDLHEITFLSIYVGGGIVSICRPPTSGEKFTKMAADD